MRNNPSSSSPRALSSSPQALSSSPRKRGSRKLSIVNILNQFSQALTSSQTPLLDCEILLAFAIKASRTYLYTRPEQTLTPEQQEAFLQAFEQRQQGKPIAYIVGHKEFWSLDLLVNSHVLIPRPETELLVEIALNLLPKDQSLEIADLGTGSGAIALAIAKERPQANIKATDYSKEALHIAEQNAERLKIKNVQFVYSNWCNELKGSFNLIVSNPPYIAEQDPHLSTGDVQFEPKDALITGPTGLEAITHLIDQCRKHLRTKGYLLFEHGYNQAHEVQTILQRYGYKDIERFQDL
ncbi:MAG: peptide chain release factor N(5)-glutamine methyltransferase, partial [Gammaproteobacteria bacterium]|nr:peptide chain release factor N(5)-glutamine methyltransferase [Gammaproteobacteria bacterium]